MKKRIALLNLLVCASFSWGAKAEGLPTDSTAHEDKAKSSLFAVPPPQIRFHNVTMTTRSIGIGGVLLGDTYLTPLNYGGTHFSFVSQSLHRGYKRQGEASLARGSLFAYTPRTLDPKWLHHTLFSLGYARTLNPAGNANIHTLELSYSRSLLRQVAYGTWGELFLGGALAGRAEGLYSTRNGNNPGTIHASLGLNVALLYSLRLGNDRFPVLARLYAETRLAGAAFSQEFGESYYELYYFSPIGRRIHLAHPFNAPSLRAVAGFDLPILDYCTLHLGYYLSLERQMINHLRYYHSAHSLLVGFTTTALPLGGRRVARSSQTPLPL